MLEHPEIHELVHPPPEQVLQELYDDAQKFIVGELSPTINIIIKLIIQQQFEHRL